jgi:hypothetical protein
VKRYKSNSDLISNPIKLNIKDTIRLHIEDRIESSEDIPQLESVSLTLIEVAIPTVNLSIQQ